MKINDFSDVIIFIKYKVFMTEKSREKNYIKNTP